MRRDPLRLSFVIELSLKLRKHKKARVILASVLSVTQWCDSYFVFYKIIRSRYNLIRLIFFRFTRDNLESNVIIPLKIIISSLRYFRVRLFLLPFLFLFFIFFFTFFPAYL